MGGLRATTRRLGRLPVRVSRVREEGAGGGFDQVAGTGPFPNQLGRHACLWVGQLWPGFAELPKRASSSSAGTRGGAVGARSAIVDREPVGLPPLSTFD